MTTDERRARAIFTSDFEYTTPGLIELEWNRLSGMQKSLYYDNARAIRESDEAAGMVLVPRDATEEMLTEGVWDISPWHPAYDTEEGRKTAMRDAWNGMIAAATEADNG